MTVGELIEHLKCFDSELQAVIPHEEPDGWWNCHDTDIKFLSEGFDCDMGKLYLIPERQLELRKDEIAKLFNKKDQV